MSVLRDYPRISIRMLKKAAFETAGKTPRPLEGGTESQCGWPKVKIGLSWNSGRQ